VKKCAHCNRSGHIREACFHWIETPDGTKWAAKNPEKAAKVRKLREQMKNRWGKGKSKGKGKTANKDDVSSQKDSIEIFPNGAWVVEEHVLSSTNSGKENDVVLDTGATHHIFHDKSLFKSLSPINMSVKTAAGQVLSVSGVGSVKFSVGNFIDKKMVKTIKIDDVWYIPECTKNLVSGPQLVRKGFKIHSNDRGLGVYFSDHTLLATAHDKGGLFCFNTSSVDNLNVRSNKSPEVLLSQIDKEATTKLIHDRHENKGHN
ncbi:hypothetical protein K3495_g16304, partial [Podosphaera aphanis]